jgi:peptidoglycan/LPS O-acetylase OafA/YrhL
LFRPANRRALGTVLRRDDQPATHTGRNAIRHDIQALRAFAVMVVLLNHLWPGLAPGGFVGVDVFYVISGFLITSLLGREIADAGRVRLGRFWARRARRLLPAALTVLTASFVGVLLWIPKAAWETVMRQIGACAVYLQNWELLHQEANYFTSANSSSPVTHCWSLAVEEQFYIVWPFLLLAAVMLGRWTGWARIAFVLLAVVCVASFSYSVRTLESAPITAYFSTLSRAWEFGIGGLLAVGALGALGALRRGRHAVRVGCALTGWVPLFVALVAVHETDPFPGWRALLPTVGTFLVIAGDVSSALPLVKSRLVQFLGNISYGMYLWHWPLVIFAPLALNSELTVTWSMAILVASVLLAWLTKTLIEDPVRNARPLVLGPQWRTYASTVVGMALMVSACWVVAGQVARQRERAVIELMNLPGIGPCIGAAALATNADCGDTFTLTVPESVLVPPDKQHDPIGELTFCMQEPMSFEVVHCAYGPDSATAATTVVVTGDSHAAHYMPAINRMAMTYGWRVEMFLRSSCPTALSDDIAPAWEPSIGVNCRRWQNDVVNEIIGRDDVDLVITSSISREYGHFNGMSLISTDTSDAYERAWTRWADAGLRVLVIGDTPHMQLGSIPECVQMQSDPHDPCTQTADVALGTDPMVVAVDRMRNRLVTRFDPTQFMCRDGVCHSVVGGLLVYSDLNHLTKSFAASLTPYLGESVLAALASTGRA